MAEELQEIRESVERCEQTHVGQEYPFCENYGCMSMRPLLDEIAQLRADLALANAGLAQAEDKIRKLSRTEL